jgi:hypothetical protein
VPLSSALNVTEKILLTAIPDPVPSKNVIAQCYQIASHKSKHYRVYLIKLRIKM